MWGIYRLNRKSGFTGLVARPGILFRNQAPDRNRKNKPGKAHICPIWRFSGCMWGIYHLNRKNGFTGRLARHGASFSRTPFKTPSAAHFITHFINCQMYF
jgi:hypothetical protein